MTDWARDRGRAPGAEGGQRRPDHRALSAEIERSLLSDPPRLIEEITLSGPAAGGHYQRRQRLYSRAEISALSEAAGLTTVEVLGDLAGAPFRTSESGALVVIAECVAT